MKKNNKSKFLKKDIKAINGNDILKLYSNNVIKVLAASPPCQPFSLLRKRFKNQNEIDPKYGLIMDFLKIIIEAKPDIVIMENVPQMESKEIFKNFINGLKELNYFITYKIVDCSKLGIPQTRKRLVLLASQFGKIDFIKPFETKKITVEESIKNLSKNYSAEDEINVYTKNEVRRKSMINNFQDILNWNYQKQGFLYLYCGKISNLIKDNPWKDVDMYIECGKSTNKQLEYYACFF